MRAKSISLLAVTAFLGCLLAVACGGSGDQAADNGAAPSGEATLRLLNCKIEIDGQLKKLAEMYQAETGVAVTIESIGGGVPPQSTLKGYYQAGNMPDIFVCEGGSDFVNWEGLLADMKDEKWAADTDFAYVDPKEGTIGFPYTIEAIGLAYNADILAKAGVDPATLTTPAALKAAFETLDAKKAELGLSAVVGYSAEATNLWWSTGNHLFGNYLDAGLARDDTTYIDKLNDGGQVDVPRLTKFAELVGLLNKYSDPALLVSGTYDQQILNFAAGKYAFVTQGSWIGATMTGADGEAYAKAGNFKAGMAPYAFDDGVDTILTSSPSWWAVFGEGHVAEAKAFLQWCAEDKGQQVLVEEANFTSPFKSCKFVSKDPLAQTIVDHMAAGKTSSWHWQSQKEGIAQNYLGQVFADYAAGNLDRDGFVQTMQQVIKACYAN